MNQIKRQLGKTFTNLCDGEGIIELNLLAYEIIQNEFDSKIISNFGKLTQNIFIKGIGEVNLFEKFGSKEYVFIIPNEYGAEIFNKSKYIPPHLGSCPHHSRQAKEKTDGKRKQITY